MYNNAAFVVGCLASERKALVWFHVASLFLQCIIGVAQAVPSCALWPLIAYLVPQHRLATAYGL